MAGLHAFIRIQGSFEEVALDHPRSLSSLESFLRSRRDADAIVVWGESAWTISSVLFKAAGRIGFNHYSIDVVDSVESILSGLDLKEIVRLRVERLIAGDASKARPRLAASKNVSRRAFLMNPLASLLFYTSAPLVNIDLCSGLPHCHLCIESCPASALNGKPPQVDPGSCIECMECVYSCPAWAIHPPGYSREGFTGYIDGLRRKGFNGVLVVAEYEYLTDLYAVAHGGSERLAVLPVHSLLHLHPRAAVEAATRGIPLVIYDPGGSSPAWMLEAEASGIAWRASSPDSLIEVSTKVNLSKPPGVLLDSTYPFAGHVEVDTDKCTLCGACVNACPTGALRLRGSLESIELLFHGDRCIGCMECVAACPADAIEARWLSRLPQGGPWRRVAWSESHKCPICGAVVGPRRQVEAIARKLREAGLPEEVVRRVYLCPSCRASRHDYIP